LKGAPPTAAGDNMLENINRQRVMNLLDIFYAGDIAGPLHR
jgi:hypothetical protein